MILRRGEGIRAFSSFVVSALAAAASALSPSSIKGGMSAGSLGAAMEKSTISELSSVIAPMRTLPTRLKDTSFMIASDLGSVSLCDDPDAGRP